MFFLLSRLEAPGAIDGHPLGDAAEADFARLQAAAAAGTADLPNPVAPATAASAPDRSSISGTAWIDSNGDGVCDDAEAVLAGITVFLDADGNRRLDPGERSVVTGRDGIYRFDDLDSGVYRVDHVAPPGYPPTYPVAPSAYRFRDSNAGDGPTFDWIDVSAVGTEVNLADDAWVEVADIGFSFEFYGTRYTSLYISSNGFLSFAPDSASCFGNSAPPLPFAPNAIIAPFWDDLDPSRSGSIYYHYDAAADRFIVQYDDVGRYGTSSTYTFEVVLSATGSILFQYQSMAGSVTSATVGIENATGDDGLQVVYNDRYIADGMAIEIGRAGGTAAEDWHEVTLSPETAVDGADFGFADATGSLGTISGTVWYDADADGVADAGEPGLPGWTVYLDRNGNGALDPGEATAATGTDSAYTFAAVEPGTVFVRLHVPADLTGWQQTFPGTGVAARATADQASAAPAATAAGDIADDITAADADGLLLCFADGVDLATAKAFLAGIGGEMVTSTVSGTLHHVRVDGNLGEALAVCADSALISFAEANWFLQSVDIAPTETVVIPNDPRFGDLWGLNNTGQKSGRVDADIDAPEAWTVTTGGSVVVGVIDTGIDYTHPDLAGNIWVNPGEIAGNGIDDDGNGYVDDIHGWDFVNNDNKPIDDNGHGTHVAGTIAASGNNGVGVTGVAWSADIMALKFLSGSGTGTTANAILAIEYATMMGADITNNSWGGGTYSQGLYNAIAAAGEAGCLFIAAAGNDYGRNNDTNPSYPASYDLDNIISVASTDRYDNLSSFSNYGLTSVDLAAPGSEIFSTLPGGTYGSKNGTSMATPHVSGAAALLLSISPDLTPAEVRDALINSVDPVSALAGKTVAGGRLNVARALDVVDIPAPDLIKVGDGEDVTGVDFGVSGPITATAATDYLIGSDGNDTIDALGGNDTVVGGGGNDVLFGGEGSDRIFGGDGNDGIDGGPGGDRLDGGDGVDRISYATAAGPVVVNLEDSIGRIAGDGDGDDSIAGFEDVKGSRHDDTLIGDAGANLIGGGEGDDLLDGGEGDDRLWGEAGNDTLIGGGGQNLLRGGSGGDLLIGGANADTLAGGSGNDTLIGGGGADWIYGDGGIDTAVFAGGFDAYTVLVSGTSARVDGADGRTPLFSVEFIQFDDGLYDIAGGAAVLV